jgi:hypothetical protein
MKTTNLTIEFGVKPVAIAIAVVEEQAVEILKEIVATNPPFEVSIHHCPIPMKAENKTAFQVMKTFWTCYQG